MILAFAHPCVVVPDLEAARTFYEEMFGFKVIGTEGWSDNSEIDRATGLQSSACRGYLLAGHNCFLELFEFTSNADLIDHLPFPRASDPGIRHLAFYVDDVWLEYDRLQRLGGIAMGVPAGDPELGFAVYCRDPFGNIIELAQVASENENPIRLKGIACLADAQGSAAVPGDDADVLD